MNTRWGRRLRLAAGVILAGLIVAGCSAVTPPSSPPEGSSEPGPFATYAQLPLGFVENRGQAEPRVRYYTQGPRHAFFLTPNEVMLSFLEGSGETAPETGVALSLRFVDANPDVVLEDRRPLPGRVSYFVGNDPEKWQTGLLRSGEIVYRNLWPGVDLALHGDAGKLKYEFRVEPGAQPEDIRLAYSGMTGMGLDNAGALVLETPLGDLRDSAPVAYQVIAGKRVPVASRYLLTEQEGQFGFALPRAYDPGAELIIDPGLEYSTFLGGAVNDFGAGITTDGAGNAYVVGTTYSATFPTTTGAFDTQRAAAPDVFVTKLNSTGTALVYSTYIGGTPAQVPAGGSDPFEFGRGIAVDASGNAFVTGQTTSSDFPTTAGAFDRTLNIGTFDATDAFVAKLNASGSALLYSTFLGGTDLDDALGIGIDGTGNAYVTGQTASTNFPTASPFDGSANGGFDAFVTKLNSSGSRLVYSTYLGGSDNELGSRVAVDGAGNAFVGGSTRSSGFPTTSGSFDTSSNGGFDAFVTKMNAAGSAPVYSTFVGGADVDFGDGLTIDSSGSAYLSGGTLSTDFPTTAGAFDSSLTGPSDAFVTKLNVSGSALDYSTFLGGSDGEGSVDVAVDAGSTAWVTGGTSSVDFPTTANGFDQQFNGGGADAYVTGLNAAGSSLVYSTFLGGSDSENGRDLALDSSANVYVTGQTFSPDYPTTPGAFDATFSGDPSIFIGDAFVTKLDVGEGPPPPPPTPAAPQPISPANGARVAQPITFDWTDVSDAASYTLQIDNSQTFSAPLVRELSVTASQATIEGLSPTRHWWRVRAVNSAGVAGPWSVVRSFVPRRTR